MALDTTATHTQAHSHDHVHGGPKIYGAIFGALVFLTVVTVGASYINFGSGMTNVIIAMLIASVKASLVALFFMHLRWDKPMGAIIFCVSLFFLGLFLIGCYSDTVSREATEPTNLKTAGPPPMEQPPAAAGQLAPMPGTSPTGTAPSGGGNSIPGASPQGSYGGEATGQTKPVPSVPAH